ncbi:MAG: hypothetical protein R2755_05030 [Acidimicrobiales bacterium]
MLFPRLQDRAAMYVNGQSVLSRVTADDIVAEAVSWPLDANVARTEVAATANSMLGALDDLPVALATVIGERARFR